jgi:formylglycine-generating enzyme required for sulfatase activity
MTSTTSPPQDSESLFTVELNPDNVERGSPNEFKVSIGSSNPSGEDLWITTIVCRIPVGKNPADLTQSMSSIAVNQSPLDFHAILPSILTPDRIYILKFATTNKVPYCLARRATLSFSFVLPVNPSANAPQVEIEVCGGRDADVNRQRTYNAMHTITTVDPKFSVRNFICEPSIILPGEPLTLSFEASGGSETDLNFLIQYPLSGSAQTLTPTRLLDATTFCASMNAEQSFKLSSQSRTIFSLYHVISRLGQEKNIQIPPAAEVTVVEPCISDFHVCDSGGNPVSAVTMGDSVRLRWILDLPLNTTFKPVYRLTIGSADPIELKASDLVCDDIADAPNQQGCTYALDTNFLPQGSLDWGTTPPQWSAVSLVLLATLRSDRVPSHPCEAKPASLTLGRTLSHFPGLKTATISQNSGAWTINKDIPIQPAPIGFLEHLSDTISLPMIWIPAGNFMMGISEDEPGHLRPQHSVQLQGFFMGQTPITQAQWRLVMEKNPSRFSDQPDSAQHPVENVNWQDAMEFCSRLGRCTGRKYTLPSEAQWEYACRAGTTTPFAYGATISPELANYNGATSYANGPTGEFRNQTTPVRTFPANPWGLQDMHGNVLEWCLDDWIDTGVYIPRDDREVGGGGSKLLRGGAWSGDPWFCRSAYRDHNQPFNANIIVGFRVVCLP